MGFFRFRRRIKIAPGVHWNIGKKGSSLSFGGRGIAYTIGPQGSRTTVGIPGTGLSYTHVQPKSPSSTAPAAASSPPPLSPPRSMSSSPQNPQKRITSKVFYTLGWIALAIWLLNKVFDQNTTRSLTATASYPSNSASPASSDYSPGENQRPSGDTGRIKEWVNQAAKRGEEWGRQSRLTANTASSPSYRASAPNPNPSPVTIRRALPVESTTPTSQSPVPTASVYTDASVESPITTSAMAVEPTYRVVKVAKRDFLYLRTGPGSDYPAMARIQPGMRGITLGSRRIANGSTIWQEISIGGYTGWVNGIYLEPDSATR